MVLAAYVPFNYCLSYKELNMSSCASATEGGPMWRVHSVFLTTPIFA